MLTGVDPPFNGTVVLLEHVIQIRHWPMPAILSQIAFGFELHDGWCTRVLESNGTKCGAPHFVPNPEYNKIWSRVRERALGGDLMKV